MEKIVIIMPTYNEAANIGGMMEELTEKYFPQIQADMHLLVVDDNSPDGTGDIVRESAKKHANIHLITGEKQGLGTAYVRGMKHAMQELKADAVVEMDADGQHPPDHVKSMVDAYLAGADYVIGSRYVPGGSIPKQWAIHRKAVSFFGNLFIRLVLFKPRIHDLTTGFRLTRVKGVLEKIDLDHLMELKRFAYKVDLMYQSIKNSQKVVEVPLKFAPRLKEKSKFSLKEMIATFKVAIILGIKDKKRFIKFGLVGFTGFVVNYLFIRVFRSLNLAEVAVWFLATEMAIISNFTLNNIWTFREEKITSLKRIIFKFFQFNLTSAGALVIQSIFGPLGVRIFGPQYTALILAFVVLFMVLPYNYFMYNAVIWRTWKMPWSKNPVASLPQK